MVITALSLLVFVVPRRSYANSVTKTGITPFPDLVDLLLGLKALYVLIVEDQMLLLGSDSLINTHWLFNTLATERITSEFKCSMDEGVEKQNQKKRNTVDDHSQTGQDRSCRY